MKLSFKMLVLILIIINTNTYAKSNHSYYDLETKECHIAIPVGYDILDGFTKKRIVFLQKKGIVETSIITIIKGNQKKYIDLLKEKLKKDNNILIKETEIVHLSYQKFKVPITNNITEYQYNIFGKSFFIGCTNVDQKDIDYIIKHCNETYNEEINTSK